jgi:hypothetical protein
MSKDDQQRNSAPDADHPWHGRIMVMALVALVFSLCLIAGRDGITEVIPDLWASAGSIAHLFGGGDWPFG